MSSSSDGKGEIILGKGEVILGLLGAVGFLWSLGFWAWIFNFIMPAKIDGLYGVSLGKPYTDSKLPSQISTRSYTDSNLSDFDPSCTLLPKRKWDPYEGKPYSWIRVSKLEKTGRVYLIEAIPRKSLQEMLSLVKAKYGIEPEVRQFSGAKKDYYFFDDPRSDRAILLWQDGWVTIEAVDYGLKKLVEKEKRELELDAL